jgi:hypothetical protein
VTFPPGLSHILLAFTGCLCGACGEPCQEQARESNGGWQEYTQLLCSGCSSADQGATYETALSNRCQNGTVRVCIDEASCSAEREPWNGALQRASSHTPART